MLTHQLQPMDTSQWGAWNPQVFHVFQHHNPPPGDPTKKNKQKQLALKWLATSFLMPLLFSDITIFTFCYITDNMDDNFSLYAQISDR